MRSIRTRLDACALLLASTGVGLAAIPLGCSDGLKAPIAAAHDGVAPLRGGTLHLAHYSDVRNLDPHGQYDAISLQAITLMFDGLVDLDHDSRVVPKLAERWDVEDGGLLYRFVLRQGVVMHDGGELTADDVKRSLERALHPATPNATRAFFEGIVGFDAYTSGKAEHLDGVTVEGRYVVTVRLKQPDAAFLSIMAIPSARPVCATAGNRYSRSWLPCGAGPFKLEPGGWQRGSSLRVVRHDRYFDPAASYLDAVEWTYLMQPMPQRFRFEDGALDMMMDPLAVDYARFVGDGRWKGLVVPLADNTIHGESMNTRMPPFDNVEIRRAVAAAIDRDAYIVNRENMTTASQLLPRPMPGYDPTWSCASHDEAAALEHMRRAGFAFDPSTGKGGWPRPIPYLVDARSTQEAAAQVLQQQLARIGLRLDIRSVSWPAYLAIGQRIDGTPMAPEGNQADYPDPSAFFEMFTTTSIDPEASANTAFYSNPTYDALVARARHEMDPAARHELYHRANDILCDEVPWAFTWAQRDVVVHQGYVRGFEAHPIWPFDVRRVWLDRGDQALEHALGGGLR
ncbi:MAG TPA: ABC transporter substrate-binding protein [Polyangiaceae bacterium]